MFLHLISNSQVAKTQRSPTGSSTSEAPPSDVSESRRPDALVTAGGAIGAAALLLILAVTLLLCRRAKRVPADSKNIFLNLIYIYVRSRINYLNQPEN